MGSFISSANVVPIPGTERVSSDIAIGKVKKADFTNYGLTVLELEDVALYARSPMSILSKLVLTGNRLSNGDVGALQSPLGKGQGLASAYSCSLHLHGSTISSYMSHKQPCSRTGMLHTITSQFSWSMDDRLRSLSLLCSFRLCGEKLRAPGAQAADEVKLERS